MGPGMTRSLWGACLKSDADMVVMERDEVMWEMGRGVVEKLYSWRTCWRLFRGVGVVRLWVYLGAKPWVVRLCLNDAAKATPTSDLPRAPGLPRRLAALAASAAALLIWIVRVMRQVGCHVDAPSLHRPAYLTWDRTGLEGRLALFRTEGRGTGGGGGGLRCISIQHSNPSAALADWQISGMPCHIPISPNRARISPSEAFLTPR